MIQAPSAPSGQAQGNPPPSIYERRDAERQLNSIRRGHRALTAACVLLSLIIGGVIWYEYPVLVTHKAELIKLPGLLQGVDAIRAHVRQTDAQIATWSRQREIDKQSVQMQMTRLTRDMRIGMASARKDISDAANAAYTRMETKVNEQVDRIDTRLASLETKGNEDRKQIAALNEELIRARQDLAQQSGKVAALQAQMDQNRTQTASQISSLQGEQDRGRHEIGTIQDQLAMDKVPFQASKGQDHELASGVSLHITRTSASRGQFDGWMALQPGQPSIAFHHQSIQEPLVFYGPQDGKRRELVITSVDRNSVSGYLLIPKETVRQQDSGE